MFWGSGAPGRRGVLSSWAKPADVLESGRRRRMVLLSHCWRPLPARGDSCFGRGVLQKKYSHRPIFRRCHRPQASSRGDCGPFSGAALLSEDFEVKSLRCPAVSPAVRSPRGRFADLCHSCMAAFDLFIAGSLRSAAPAGCRSIRRRYPGWSAARSSIGCKLLPASGAPWLGPGVVALRCCLGVVIWALGLGVGRLLPRAICRRPGASACRSLAAMPGCAIRRRSACGVESV